MLELWSDTGDFRGIRALFIRNPSGLIQTPRLSAASKSAGASLVWRLWSNRFSLQSLM